MYQSVFVIAEERRECVIATEVSPKKTDLPLEMHHVVPSALSLTLMTRDEAIFFK